tara:strand:+ start:806 stop:1012 length:207 start_codon:yes stop_codon:yes gene_type:complete
VDEIGVGSLVIFHENFTSEIIPNVGIVLSIISFDDLSNEKLNGDIIWYSVKFGDVDIVVSSEMVILLN